MAMIYIPYITCIWIAISLILGTLLAKFFFAINQSHPKQDQPALPGLGSRYLQNTPM